MDDAQELIRRARAGDVDARERLFERYQARVLALVHRRLGPGLRAELETVDVAQSVLGDAVRDLHRLDAEGESEFVGWLAAMVENKLRNKHRDARRMKRDAGPLVPIGPVDGGEGVAAIDPLSPDTSPSSRAGNAEQAVLLRAALAELPEDLQRIVTLRHEQGLSWREVATALGLTVKAAQRRYERARPRLAALIDALERGPTVGPAAAPGREARCAPKEPEADEPLALLQAGRVTEALALCDARLTRRPDDARALRHRALVRQALGDLDGFAADLEAAWRIVPRALDARVLAEHFRCRGDDARAARWDAEA